MSRQPCRFFNSPSGCRRSDCRFAHVSAPQAGSSPPDVRDGIGTTAKAPAISPAASSAMPNGTCSFYWKTGNCNRGFQCRYKHDLCPELRVRANTSPTSSTSTFGGASALAPFLTPAGLARLSGVGSDALFSPAPKPRTPSEVHNTLKRFLYDDYAFRNALDAYAFLNLINSATTTNSSWTSEDGQLLLSAISKGNGLKRINDILAWEKVSTRADYDRSVLSFQRGYIPLFQYLSSDFVIHSILSHLINALYMVFMEHFDSVSEKIQHCMEDATTVHRTYGDGSIASKLGGAQVFGTLISVLLQSLTRIKNATMKYPRMRPLVLDLSKWLDAWVVGISAAIPTFRDPLTSSPTQMREQICQHLRTKADQLVAIVNREQQKARPPPQPRVGPRTGSSLEGTLAALHNSYVGPGELRTEGPRHDNDFEDISDIRIPPTHGELTCRLLPFLPANLHGAPHPLPQDSIERLLDIQFRLLREELTASLRISVQRIVEDLMKADEQTQLSNLLERGGGKYRGHKEGQEDVLFNVYTDAQFIGVKPDRKGMSVEVYVDTPPGKARSPEANKRATFWEGMSSKRLLSGGLVALIWQKDSGEIDVHLGTIASSVRDHVASARNSADRIAVRISFFDPQVDLTILHELRRPLRERGGVKLLIEATVMFASVRPFLEALRVEPTSIPFSRYLGHHPPNTLSTIRVEPPAYAKVPDFIFQLSSLFPTAEGVENLELCVTDEESIRVAREELRTRSRLDPSQGDAVIDALTREVALIQGPPGTGKSYTGVELLRVLLANGAGPVLMIAFTNHALDHMLCSVLDANITQKVVRLGSRSADERIQKFSIEAMEQLAGRSLLSQAFASNYRDVKGIEKKINELMKDCMKPNFDTEDLMRWLEIHDPVLYEDLTNPPPWVDTLHKFSQESSQRDGGYIRVGKGGREEVVDDSIHTYWLSSEDLTFLTQAHIRPISLIPPVDTSLAAPVVDPSSNSFSALATLDEDGDSSDSNSISDIPDDFDLDDPLDDVPPEEAWMFVQVEPTSPAEVSEDEHAPESSPDKGPAEAEQPSVQPSITTSQSEPETNTIRPADFRDVREFFALYGYDHLPSIPSGDREAEILVGNDSVWTMSSAERLRLQALWSQRMALTLQQTREDEYRRLREQYIAAVEVNNEGRAAARCELLRNVDIIGCTTTGAANLTAFLKTIGPRVLLVEEAGQVLEAHILGSLVPSIQHMILIGDPLQLRPTLNNYSLSMDHRTGGQIYKFDQSLMERLSSSGFPMSQIDVQRRMRPSISELIRNTLYPRLEDHPLVKDYPHVRGMHRNVFFMTHNHRENGGEDDAISKYNQFEVDVIVDLVMYFLRQGPYSEEGDIVVLCAYLGQLARMRDALSNKVAVVIDERDQRDLADREAERDDVGPTVEHVKVTRRVRLRTIDNFQGEEAKIVILSLVRNSGGSDEDEDVHGHSNLGRANVGFLRSENRINVALSRAREGLYILGNAKDFSSKSKMWKDVIVHLDSKGCVGDAIPIACQQHPEHVQYISKPGELPRISPDGGCLMQCDARLSCGHVCPFKCHSDDPKHLTVKCEQLCTKLCPRNHPCSKPCAENCGQCTTSVYNVELPCGHIIVSVPCALLDDLSQVKCTVRTRKQLPTCEHDLEMDCSDDPALFDCLSACGGILPCCGRNCNEQCSRCQSMNRPEDENAIPQRIERKEHHKHPCQKRLYCEHPCAEMCSRDHTCTTVCRFPCRQLCSHARCRDHCSEPCAPCQEPCTWNCPHFECPVPCGSICARLPCDQRCQEILQCGHQCPSVCGENCATQVCPVCAPVEQQHSVVDFIMQRTLAEVDPTSNTLDELLITIPACGHVFTVETLDGHCSMTDYYRRDSQDERWIGLQTPPPGFRRPPTCPTCRAAITCHRYGRVFKRADLDILENNVAFNMSQSIQMILRNVNSFSLGDSETLLRAAASNADSKFQKPPRGDPKLRQRKQRTLLQRAGHTPLPYTSLDPASPELHGASPAEVKVWRVIVKPLLSAYLDATNVSGTRSAHTHAWEASFSYLYQKELQRFLHDPDHAPRNPQEHAMRMASMGVGQPRPIADQRFLVEALWLTVNIRLTLAQLTQTWIEGLCERRTYPAESRQIWDLYMAFLYRGCYRDTQLALTIAQSSGSYRQAMKTHLLTLRVELEQFRFNVDGAKKMDTFNDQRKALLERAKIKSQNAHQRVATALQEHLHRRKSHQNEERAWLAENFEIHTKTIFSEWNKLESALSNDTFYQPLSLNEMKNIVRGLNFSHTGHFYKCPRGHTFVIGDCGGAMQQSTCPECGEAIGGYNHERVQGTRRDMEFERIATAQGALRSPYAWAQLENDT